MKERHMSNNKSLYLGKIILIGITFQNEYGDVIEEFQTHGLIKEIDSDGIMKIERMELPTLSIPFVEKCINVAVEGVYKEKSTDIKINNPDYLSTWLITIQNPEDIEKNKLYGFIAPDEKD